MYANSENIFLLRTKSDSNNLLMFGLAGSLIEAGANKIIDDGRKTQLDGLSVKEQAEHKHNFLIPLDSLTLLKLQKKSFGNIEMTVKWLDQKGKKKEVKGFVGLRSGLITKDKEEKFKEKATAVQELLEGIVPEEKLQIIDK